VDLPPALADELSAHLAAWPHEHPFCGSRGGLHRRSNFSRRVLTPAVADVAPGLTFHGLRHSHKVLLVELGVPEVLQCERLGHEQAGIAGVYSHVSAVMRQRAIDDMEQRHGQACLPRAAVG
jgi:integrase